MINHLSASDLTANHHQLIINHYLKQPSQQEKNGAGGYDYYGQCEYPSEHDISNSLRLEAAHSFVGHHASGNARRQDMGSAHRPPKLRRQRNGGGGHGFGACSLCVGEVFFSDFFAHGFHNPFPAYHRADSQ